MKKYIALIALILCMCFSGNAAAITMNQGVLGVAIEDRYMIIKALSGDNSMVVSPATATLAPTSDAWTKKITVTVCDADGNVAKWLNKSYVTTVSIADTSTAGTATIASTTITFVNGVASITITGSANAWLTGETVTLTIGAVPWLGYTMASKTCVITFTP